LEDQGQLILKRTLRCASCGKGSESMIVKELAAAVEELDLHSFEQRGQGDQIEKYINLSTNLIFIIYNRGFEKGGWPETW
jgi:hypothetical protein